MALPIDPRKVREAAGRNLVVQKLFQERQSAFQRFPLLFTLLTTFGFVATLYGFEHLLNRVDLLVENPFIMLGVGVLTLLLTGTLYKKL